MTLGETIQYCLAGFSPGSESDRVRLDRPALFALSALGLDASTQIVDPGVSALDIFPP